MLNKPLQIGITGGIGSGKSLVCRVFEVMGVAVYYADDRAKQLIAEDIGLRKQIKTAFGEQSFTDEVYNRTYIASLVFNNPDKLIQLNNIVHPAVAKDFESWVEGQGKVKYVIKEAALLLEGQNNKGLSHIFVVTAPEEIRVARVLARDPQRNIEQITRIIAQQMPEAEMIKRASGFINNSGDVLLIPQVLGIHRSLGV